MAFDMQPLTLLPSALNDAERALYMESFCDFAINPQPQHGPSNDIYYEHAYISVAEVRAWLRGRFPTVSLGQIDDVHR